MTMVYGLLLYEVKRSCGEIVSMQHVRKINAIVDKKNVVTICRQYGTHQATPKFKCIGNMLSKCNWLAVLYSQEKT